MVVAMDLVLLSGGVSWLQGVDLAKAGQMNIFGEMIDPTKRPTKATRKPAGQSSLFEAPDDYLKVGGGAPVVAATPAVAPSPAEPALPKHIPGQHPEPKIETVTNKDTGKQTLTFDSPYHPDMPPRARALGGKWHDAHKHWHFDPRDEADVRSMARDIYGTDGTDDHGHVDVHVHLGRSREQTVYGVGRQLAHRYARDSRVKLGDGVRLAAGGFPDHGGSRKSPDVESDPGTKLLVRDVPDGLAARAVENEPEKYSIAPREVAKSLSGVGWLDLAKAGAAAHPASTPARGVLGVLHDSAMRASDPTTRPYTHPGEHSDLAHGMEGLSARDHREHLRSHLARLGNFGRALNAGKTTLEQSGANVGRIMQHVGDHLGAYAKQQPLAKSVSVDSWDHSMRGLTPGEHREHMKDHLSELRALRDLKQSGAAGPGVAGLLSRLACHADAHRKAMGSDTRAHVGARLGDIPALVLSRNN